MTPDEQQQGEEGHREKSNMEKTLKCECNVQSETGKCHAGIAMLAASATAFAQVFGLLQYLTSTRGKLDLGHV